MNVTLKSDETLFAGNVPVVVPAGTSVKFPNAETFDRLAGELAASPSLYAQFRDDLEHEETVERIVEEGGERKHRRVHVAVTYGAGGTRNEQVLEVLPEETEEASAVEPTPIAVGDVVLDGRAEVGTPAMTVVGVSESGEVKCAWFVGTEPHEGTFPADVLVKAKADAAA
jgi:uncharacterized protein YodC (DUF2158 family)